MKAMDMLNESAETPASETPAEDQGEGMEGKITDAIQSALPNLSPDELSQAVSAVMGVVSGNDGLDDMESFTKKSPHPLGEQFE